MWLPLYSWRMTIKPRGPKTWFTFLMGRLCCVSIIIGNPLNLQRWNVTDCMILYMANSWDKFKSSSIGFMHNRYKGVVFFVFCCVFLVGGDLQYSSLG